MTDIVYTQDVIYELELTLHARVMLAFRYGIVLDNNFNEFIFKRTKSWGEKGGSVDIFHINNRKVVLVVNREEKVIITALPEPGLWETTDAIEEFTVTFQYDFWEVTGGITGTSTA